MASLRVVEHKADLILRLKRVEGQLRGIQNMIESDAECEKIAQQLTASRKALDKCFYTMVACAIEQAATSGKKPDPALAQAMAQVANMLARFA